MFIRALRCRQNQNGGQHCAVLNSLEQFARAALRHSHKALHLNVLGHRFAPGFAPLQGHSDQTGVHLTRSLINRASHLQPSFATSLDAPCVAPVQSTPQIRPLKLKHILAPDPARDFAG